MKCKIVFLLPLLSFSSFAFEINTHQAITSCALSNKCITIKEQQGAENLNYFALTMGLSDSDYDEEIFEGYAPRETYLNYAIAGAGLGDSKGKFPKLIQFDNGQTTLENATDENGNIHLGEDGKPTNLIDYSKTSYISLIEAGSILEDALFHDAFFLGDGRFNNHFYSAQFTYPARTPYAPPPLYVTSIAGVNMLRQSPYASLAMSPFDAYGARTDNISWALDASVALGITARKNDYNLPNAFKYFAASFNGSKKEREVNQAKLFVSLGHILHLLEDLHSPAHVRNAAHPGGDYLEIYARHNGGFLLRDGKFASTNEDEIVAAVKNIDVQDIMLSQNHYRGYEHFFFGEADWVSKNFFSEAHNFFQERLEKHLYYDTDTPGVNLDRDKCWLKNTSIFDTDWNTLSLKESQTSKALSPDALDYSYIINSTGNVSEQVKGDISTDTVVAFEKRSSLFELLFTNSYFDECKTLAAPKNIIGHNSYTDFDKTALKDTAKHVIPRAVASVQAFMNYFFRGRMKASLSFNNQFITVENVSNPHLVDSNDSLIFKKDTDPYYSESHQSFKLYYIDGNDVSERIGTFSLNEDIKSPALIDDIKHERNKASFYIGSLLEDKGIDLKPGDNRRLILVFDGQIGNADILRGVDNYNLGSTGLSSTFVKKAMVKQTGDELSYSNFDDGWYQEGAISHYINDYKSGVNGQSDKSVDTVLDVTTGLMWQNDLESSDIKMRYYNSLPTVNPVTNEVTYDHLVEAYCEDLNLSEYNDWRLPTVVELLSMLDHSSLFLDAFKEGAFNPDKFTSFKKTGGNWASDLVFVPEIDRDLRDIHSKYQVHLDTGEFATIATDLPVGFDALNQPIFGKAYVRCVRSFTQ